MHGVGLVRLLEQESKQMNICNLTLCVLLFLTASSSSSCPARCVCETTTVNCVNQGLRSIPQPLPEDVTTLNISGNNMRNLNNESFPSPLKHLTSLYVHGSQVEHLDFMVFANLPSLRFLDLSNNTILYFSPEAFSQDNKIEFLNLSRSLYNYSYVGVFANLFKHSLPKVTRLDLSNNNLVVLPQGTFTSLSNLTVLDLRNNSLVSIMNGTFQNRALEELDLRDNALKNLPNGTLADFRSVPDLSVRLARNPWHCDCNIEDMLIWLKTYDFVVDKLNMTCSNPSGMENVPLLQMEPSQLSCTYTGDMNGVLETSYVFLGMVLALIGVIFLLVLYLNRKGIKKWIYNIRDACRDHMEGYHYRYEINSDPRLANLSLNSEV